MGKIHVKSYIVLTITGIMVRLLSLKMIYSLLNKVSQREKQVKVREAYNICEAVHKVSKFCLYNTKCLERSITCAVLCWLDNVDINLCIGVSRLPFESHAWNEIRGFPIFEDKGRIKRYKIIVKY